MTDSVGFMKRAAVVRVLLHLTLVSATGCAGLPVETVSNPPLSASRARVSIDDRAVVAYVLGSGAARGFAHVGVLTVLEENGIVPDIIVGTSAGSLVGALYAGGVRGEALLQAAMELDRADVTDWSFPDRGVIRGTLLQRLVNEHLRQRAIEDLNVVFAAVATDLQTGKRTVFTRGNTGMAVRASSAVPGVFRPVPIRNRDYVDGGVISPVPVEVARELGGEVVIAVDVSKLPEHNASIASTWQVLYQSYLIMSHTLVQSEIDDADVVIRPDVAEISVAGFDQRQHAIEEGKRAALAMVPRIKRLMAEGTLAKQTPGKLRR